MEGSVTVKYDGKILLSSGGFITFGEGVTEVEIDYKGDTMYLKLIFEDSEDDPDFTTKAQILEEDTGLIRFLNFNTVLGGHNTEPIPLGTIAQHKIWFLYKIKDLEDTKRKHFIYSFYVSEDPI